MASNPNQPPVPPPAQATGPQQQQQQPHQGYQAYQPGVGAPVNQQFLQQQQPSGAGAPVPAGAQQQPPYNPQMMSADGQLSSHFSQQQQQQQPPPQPPSTQSQGYPPPPSAQHYEPAGGSGQNQPYFPPPPSQAPSQVPDQSFPPPPPSGPGQQYPSQMSEQTAYYPPPPLASGAQQPSTANLGTSGYVPPLPPRRQSAAFADDDPSNPIHYTRDPHRLVAYIVPLPKPVVKGVETAGIPDRFLIYTPPPPPLVAPPEGVKEDKLHKVQRKWQEEVRSAKTSDAKTASWKGVKGKATKGINFVMSKTTSSSLDFVNRIPGARSPSPGPDTHQDDGKHEGDETHKTVGLEEMVLVYPLSHNVTPEQMQVEFVNSMMRTRSKAQKDAVLATGLLPVSAAIDILATFIWPFGGLLEIDGVWAYSSIRGAKTARSVTKRLSSTGTAHHETEEAEMQGEKLHLNFRQSPRLDVLQRYLAAKCFEKDPSVFPRIGGPSPTETEVLNAIGWAPSQTGQNNKNWEDEQWETEEVKDDMKLTLGKAAREWDKWCKAFAKDPEKALKR